MKVGEGSVREGECGEREREERGRWTNIKNNRSSFAQHLRSVSSSGRAPSCAALRADASPLLVGIISCRRARPLPANGCRYLNILVHIYLKEIPYIY
jgi:hypothetical protein